VGNWGDPFPKTAASWSGDYIISYLSRWIVPPNVIGRARIAAINFHPGPPEYPGVGCVNFAIYEGATQYGVTCHHMVSAVDSGPIIDVQRFPALPTDNVASLLSQAHLAQLEQFMDIMSRILMGKPLPQSEERWTRRPFTRRQLDDLARITPEMSREEVARRVRATTYGAWKPTVEIAGFRFVLE
jgi:methionyl-tRNA formyltransferase